MAKITRGELLEIAAFLERLRMKLKDLGELYAVSGTASPQLIQKAEAIGALTVLNELSKFLNTEIEYYTKLDIEETNQ